MVWADGEPVMPMASAMVSIVKDLKKSGELEKHLGEFAMVEPPPAASNGIVAVSKSPA